LKCGNPRKEEERKKMKKINLSTILYPPFRDETKKKWRKSSKVLGAD